MSLIKAIKAQLGLSVTPANNFTLDAAADNGTMKLARGNAGATTQDIMTVDAAGKVAFPQNVVPIFSGTFGASGIASGSTDLPMTPQIIVGVTQVGPVLTPQVPGWYQCTCSAALNVTSSSALGAYIQSTTAGAQQQIQAPYSAAYAFSIASALVYCNGTTDTIIFGCYSSSAGGNVTSARGSLVLVRRA